MNKDKLREELADDEGCKLEIYLDHLGLPTFGIGHLGNKQKLNEIIVNLMKGVGASVENDKDLDNFDFDDLPEEAQLVIANMCFNLGYPRLSKFKGMKAGVDARDWQRAADEMVDSRWHDQVPNRAKRLVKRMRALSDA